MMPQVKFNLGHNFMAKAEEASIDDILKSIREAIIDKEQKKYFAQFMTPQPIKKEPMLDDEIFVLSRNMLVQREDIPYQLGVWSFDDVAKKIMKKYKNFFSTRVPQSNDNV